MTDSLLDPDLDFDQDANGLYSWSKVGYKATKNPDYSASSSEILSALAFSAKPPTK